MSDTQRDVHSLFTKKYIDGSPSSKARKTRKVDQAQKLCKSCRRLGLIPDLETVRKCTK